MLASKVVTEYCYNCGNAVPVRTTSHKDDDWNITDTYCVVCNRFLSSLRVPVKRKKGGAIQR